MRQQWSDELDELGPAPTLVQIKTQCAADVIAFKEKRKLQAVPSPPPFQFSVGGISLPPLVDRSTNDWCFESDSTNARMHRIAKELVEPRRWWGFWRRKKAQ